MVNTIKGFGNIKKECVDRESRVEGVMKVFKEREELPGCGTSRKKTKLFVGDDIVAEAEILQPTQTFWRMLLPSS